MATRKNYEALSRSFPAADRDQFLWDEELKGFGLKLTPKGARYYIHQYRLGGREAKVRRYTIGGHGPPWTPTTTRGRPYGWPTSLPKELIRSQTIQSVGVSLLN